MQVDKVINNNLIRSHDEKGQEVLVMGCGIGFKKKPGEYIDDGKVEKVYVLQKEERQHMEELFSSMPLNVSRQPTRSWSMRRFPLESSSAIICI